MNRIKFRPVGSPSGEIVTVKVSQTRRAITAVPAADGKRFHRPQSITVAAANREMLRRGFVRVRG